jgi:hypothetical protein
MRSRQLIACAALACTLVPTASAHASRAPTFLKVRACEVGDTPKARHATFYARMRAVRGTSQMAMRFTLINRAGEGPPTVIDSPALTRWRRSNPGVARFGYAQSVAGLESGGVYAVQVHFRWIDQHGQVIRAVRRASDSCRQQGELPNLAVTRVAGRAGESYGTALYSVDVKNTGRGEAHFVGVDLFVDGVSADAQRVDLIKPGETVTVHFTGPTCTRKIRGVADGAGTLSETNEDDNALRTRCPAAAR